MDTEFRFSSPFLDNLDLELLKNTFNENADNIIEILEHSPYGISIIVCLLKKLDNKLNIK